MIKHKVDINIVAEFLLDTGFVKCNFTVLELKHLLLFRQKREDNVGFPFVCYEYVLWLLVNKENALAYDRVEYS